MLIFLFVLVSINLFLTKQACKVARHRYIMRQKQLRDETQKHENENLIVKIKKYIADYMDSFIRYKLRLLGKFPSHRFRKFILTYIYGMQLGKNVVIYGGFEIRNPWNIVIGDGTIIGDECKLDGRNGIIIGKNVNFSTGAWLWTEQHEVNDIHFACKGGPIIIEDFAWISSRTIILPNIRIKEGVVIAAGAILSKSTECSYAIYGGIPAKKIGYRNKNLAYQFDGTHFHFY